MAEDVQTNAPGEGDDAPKIVVPTHDPLPPPPEVHYTRPNITPRSNAATGSQIEFDNRGGGSVGSTSMKYTTGVAGGVTLASSILAGYWLGAQIDARWLHTQTPWATIVMVLAGTFVGFYNMFRLLKRAERLDREKK